VHDEAKVLSQQTATCWKTGFAVVNLKSNSYSYRQSLDGEPIEEYSLHVAEKWKLGQEKDNGVLPISVDDRKYVLRRDMD
jgi:uncharacterized protein